MVTVYADPADQKTYTFGASTIFEVYIYTTTQDIDIVGPGQHCNGAVPLPTPIAGWNPLTSLGDLFGLSSATATAIPFDPYATEDLPTPGGSDSSFVEASAPLGEDGLPIYPEYSETDPNIGFDAGPAPASAARISDPPIVLPAFAPAADIPSSAAGLPSKRALTFPRAMAARRCPVAVEARVKGVA